MEEFFDSNFFEKYWDKFPVVFTDTGYQPLTESGALQLINLLMMQLATDKDTAGVRVFANESQITKSQMQQLIEMEMHHVRDFAGLISQAQHTLNAQSFALVINDIGKIEPGIQRSIEDFVSVFVERVGIPARETEIGLFGGNYRKTPFGIHRDLGNDNITFGVVGEKDFLLWPPDYFSGKVVREYQFSNDGENIVCDQATYEMFRKDAIRMTVKPGDILYWPDWWHIADVATDKMQLTLSLGFWRNVDLADFASQQLKELLHSTLSHKGIYKGYYVADTRLPEKIEDLEQHIAQLIEQGKFRESLQQWWSGRLQKKGFTFNV